ncbi:hypothetical protein CHINAEXTREME_18790 [Halobiforma lacisalsi AJ5]|uniref:Uncharacterized protein n=1 Tax=Natronobacterium lacisalsi AJ5 TaxID=358396 RepID=M0LSK8_NATLA|nr:hypothetical protein [Halobiforma lacisalsi]APW99692.1 hypothetical protein CHINAEXTREME_18790 [Halobiforma lacisalsi AJ5]EMA36138.1 hypothetical protein C445_04753 [Halobiforma lacisalsi AJ5]
MVTDLEGTDRGQIILIGAITLAFIILGVVVVFNGVLYTETISSGTSSQAATTEEVSGYEVEQHLECLLATHDGSDKKSDFEAYTDAYRNVSSQSSAGVTNVSLADDSIDPDGPINVTITYDTHEFSYNQTREIDPGNGNCPEEP